MGTLQGMDEITSEGWRGLQRKPRGPALFIVLGVLALAAVGTLVWWMIAHGWPEHQIRQDTAALRSVELPRGFEPAPLVCAGGAVLCAWTDLAPADAADAVRSAAASTGLDAPELLCGVGTPVPYPGYIFSEESLAPGVCVASSPRHGVTLDLVARDALPLSERDGEPVSLPRTLVTVGWYFDSMSRSIPGTSDLEDHEIWILPEELENLPAPLNETVCTMFGSPGACMTATLVYGGEEGPEEFWRVAEQLLATGTVIEIECDADGCTAVGLATRAAHPGQSLRYSLTDRDDEHPGRLVLSIHPWV